MENKKIKFSAWDEGNKVMHYDFQFIKSGEESNDWIVFTSDKQKLTDNPHPFENPYLQSQFKIRQFVGLTDDNDKEIYEGDIIQFMSISVDKPVVVEWNDDICQFQFSDGQPINSGDTYGVYKAVIGNIYENHDLLK